MNERFLSQKRPWLDLILQKYFSSPPTIESWTIHFNLCCADQLDDHTNFLKNPLPLSGFEPETFRLRVERDNHFTTEGDDGITGCSCTNTDENEFPQLIQSTHRATQHRF